MVHEEGFRRLKIIVRTITTVGLGLMTLSAALSLLSKFLTGANPMSGIFFLPGLYLFALGGFLWAVMWVAEGFVRGPKAPSQ
jgi:hypothetical protein